MDETLLVTQFSSAFGIVWLIQELKKAGWCTWITKHTHGINRLISALAAIASSVAINWTWDNTTSTLTISGLTAYAIFTFFWQAFQQFVGQEFVYQFVYAPKDELRAAASKVTHQTARATDKVVGAIEEHGDK